MTSIVKDQNIAKLNKNIEDISEKIESYFDKHSKMKKNIPETKVLIYNRIAYPIIYEIKHFYYLGGKNLYMVMKAKCLLKSTGKVNYYEVIASESDIGMGKSPIIPKGCSLDKNVVYPGDTGPLEKKI